MTQSILITAILSHLTPGDTWLISSSQLWEAQPLFPGDANRRKL